MTDHKHLKRRVRARMAKTGESYTTAHRHVTAPPAGHRESSLLARLLTRSGVHAYDETTLYGLGGGIGFMYFVFEYQGMHPSLTIVAQAHPAPMIPTALSRIGVPYEIKQTGSARVAERTLRETLAEGRPAICTVGAFSLPWRPRLPYPDPLDVAVLALEEQDGTTVVHLDDPLPGTTTPTKWTIPLPDFMTAWSAPKKDRHRLITIPTTPDVTPGPNAAHEAVADTAAKLTGPVLGNAFDVNFGLSGMAKLATHLADRRTKEGWTRRFSDPEAFFTAMTRLHACLETDHTAPAAGRPLYAAFLDRLATHSGPTQALHTNAPSSPAATPENTTPPPPTPRPAGTPTPSPAGTPTPPTPNALPPTPAAPPGPARTTPAPQPSYQAAARLFHEAGAVWSDIATTAIAHEAFTRYRTHLAEFRQFLRQPGTPQPTAVARAQDLYTHLFATAAADAHLLASTETRATILATLAEKVAQAHHLESQAVELLAPRVP